jgi:hypothetical protein
MTPACSSCGQTHDVVLAMLPGPDGKPWSICARCYLADMRVAKTSAGAGRRKRA